MSFIKKEEDSKTEVQQTVVESKAPTGNCPDCKGMGIRNPEIDHQVCQTCQGSGNI